MICESEMRRKDTMVIIILMVGYAYTRTKRQKPESNDRGRKIFESGFT